jgi:hypothetical protein
MNNILFYYLLVIAELYTMFLLLAIKPFKLDLFTC